MLPQINSYLDNGQLIEMQFNLSPDLFWFRGHFDGCPILPGMAQLDWVMHFVQEVWPDKQFEGISNLKFTLPMQPNDQVRLCLAFSSEKAEVLFHYYILRQGIECVASTGKVNLCK